MRVPNLGETDLLVPLHEGVFEAPLWRTFLDRLRQVARADQAALAIRSAGAGDDPLLTTTSGGELPMLEALLGVNDQALLPRMREGRVYGTSDLAELVTLPPGLPNLQVMRLGGSSGLDAIILVVGQQELGADSARLLSALGPHMQVALRVLAGLERERARVEMSAEAFARINFGWISLDRRCRIVDCDPQAARLLQQSGPLRRGPYDRLLVRDPQVDRQIDALVGEFAADPKARPRAINLSHDPWIDILVAPLRIESLAGGNEAAAVIYIRGDRTSSADRHEQLVELFDLTASEARMAWSMAQGLSIAEAAVEHGLTIETARNYSKKIYAKTGARGQVDLVRHVLTGVLALA